MKCINGVVSWFKLTHENYLFWTRSDDRFKCGRSSWFGGDDRGFDYVNLFVMHIRRSFGSFSCSSVSFMNDDFVLYWATSVKVVFSCVLEIELQSTRVYMYAIRKKFQKRWITWLELGSGGLRKDWTIFLMILFVIIFLFLVGTRGATIAEAYLRLEADWSKSGWMVIITFFIGDDPCRRVHQGRLEKSGMAPRCWS